MIIGSPIKMLPMMAKLDGMMTILWGLLGCTVFVGVIRWLPIVNFDLVWIVLISSAPHQLKTKLRLILALTEG